MDPRYKSPAANVDLEPEDDFGDLEGLTNALKWVFLVGALISALGLLSYLMQFNLQSRSFATDESNEYVVREAAITLLGLFYAIAAFIVFAVWIVRAHRNLPALGAGYVEVTPGWAVGWFFVPIVSIWFPYRAMRWLWRASHSVHRPELQDSTWLLPTWWGLWLACGYLKALPFISHIAALALYVVGSILVVRIWEAQRSQRENPGEFDPAPGFAG